MIALLQKIDDQLTPLRKAASCYGAPVLDLIVRLYMANIFFKSGLIKLTDIMNGNFDRVVLAFTDFYPIPGVPPGIAAVAGTIGEIALPIMLAIGLFTRFGAAGLIFMTIVIQFIVPAEYELSNPQHYVWMILLAVPLAYGPRMLSADYWLVKYLRKDK